MRQDELGQPSRPEEVDLELVAGIREGPVLGGAVESEAGTVDEDVPALVANVVSSTFVSGR